VDRRVTYDLGTVTNGTNSDATITLTYRAIVLNIPANVTGTTLDNSALWSWTGGSTGPVSTTVTVAEPQLTITKTADVNFIANGSEVTFTLTVAHTQASNSDAYDVVLTDVLPTGLSYVANSLNCTLGAQDPDLGCTVDVTDPTQPTIRAQWSVFTRNGGNGVIRFRVAGNSSLPTNASVVNTANVEWSSMPGDQTAPHSKTPNVFSGERHYDPLHGVTVYISTSSATLTPLGVTPPPGGGTGGGGGRGGTGGSGGGFVIPVTGLLGFAPNTVTELNVAARPAYAPTTMTLEIPSIKVNAPIMSVKLKDGQWDFSWLANQIGWFEGTAYPTWDGNSVLGAHVVSKYGTPGLFADLSKVHVGDYIFLYNSGYRYTYQITSNKFTLPNDLSAFKHEDKPTLTLITCDTYDAKTGTYLRRVVVRAALIDVSKMK
jgi:LPXTG-site transpeptidase (sortase) family protein